MATVLPPTKTHKDGRSLDVVFLIDGHAYQVSRLAVDVGVGSRAFRFVKPDGATYDLHECPHGLECECQGFLRWGHCKHVAAVQAAGALFGAPCRPPAVADRWFGPVSDDQLAEAMRHAPAQPEPSAEEVEDMARYFGQQ